MKKQTRSKSSSPRIDPYLEGMMSKLLERLVALEKKMDLVVTQTSGRSADVVKSPVAESKPAPRRERQLYEAICADCHKVCEVPFRPSEDRPVYCKDCFAKRKSGSAPKPSFMPVLTPVALPPKPEAKMSQQVSAPSQPEKKQKKVKKSKKRK